LKQHSQIGRYPAIGLIVIEQSIDLAEVPHEARRDGRGPRLCINAGGTGLISERVNTRRLSGTIAVRVGRGAWTLRGGIELINDLRAIMDEGKRSAA